MKKYKLIRTLDGNYVLEMSVKWQKLWRSFLKSKNIVNWNQGRLGCYQSTKVNTIIKLNIIEEKSKLSVCLFILKSY